MTSSTPERAGDRSRPQKSGRSTAQIGVSLLAAMGALYGLLAISGTALVHGSVPPFLTRWDSRLRDWAVAHRTPTLDLLTHVGSLLAETFTIMGIAVLAGVMFRVWLGRWRESVVLAVAVLGELLIFLAITATVHRHRPSVSHLDPAPPTSSFPSGHTGAAMALYGCLAVIALRNIGPQWVAVTVAAVGYSITVVVGASRVYRGMHYVSDVIAGALAGGLWLAVVVLVLLPGRPHRRRRNPDPQGRDTAPAAS